MWGSRPGFSAWAATTDWRLPLPPGPQFSDWKKHEPFTNLAIWGADRNSRDVVCAGNSITGWNNFGPCKDWPVPTHPCFLHELCRPLDLRVADGGIAGEISDKGMRHVQRYLRWFAKAQYFVIGFRQVFAVLAAVHRYRSLEPTDE